MMNGNELERLIQECNTKCFITPQMVSVAVRRILQKQLDEDMLIYAEENGKERGSDDAVGEALGYTESYPLALAKEMYMLPSVDGYLQLFDQRFMFRQCRTVTWVTTVLYLLRLTQVPGFRVTEDNIHMCLLGCISIAVKWLIDTSPYSTYFASVGRITLLHHISVERVILRLLNYRLFIHTEPFAKALLFVLGRKQTEIPLVTMESLTSITDNNQHNPITDLSDCSSEDSSAFTSPSSSEDYRSAESTPIEVPEPLKPDIRIQDAEDSSAASTDCCCIGIKRSLFTLFSTFRPKTPTPDCYQNKHTLLYHMN